MTRARLSKTSARHLLTLVALYAAQGIPFGFATLFLPLEIAHRADFTYAKATLVQLAGFPWFLKLVWAPAVDTRYSPRLGRRRSWILPAQTLLALTGFAAMALDFHGPLVPIFVLVAVFNLWASVQDTAVDALAVDVLTDAKRGLGNAAQVGGYKVGMLLGGSGLVYVAAVASTRVAMFALGAGVLVLMLAIVFFREPPPTARVEQEHRHEKLAVRQLAALLREPGWLATFAFIATLKIGESMVNSILKPFLVREAHFTDQRAAFAIGIVGGVLSLAGSATGGWAAGAYGRLRMLKLFGIVQALVVFALGAGIKLGVDAHTLTSLIGVEHFGVGLVTPALFAYMMDVTDPVIGATQYTLFATVELLTRSLAGAGAGPLAGVVSASSVMMLGAVAGALPLLLLPFVRRPRADDVALETA